MPVIVTRPVGLFKIEKLDKYQTSTKTVHVWKLLLCNHVYSFVFSNTKMLKMREKRQQVFSSSKFILCTNELSIEGKI